MDEVHLVLNHSDNSSGFYNPRPAGAISEKELKYHLELIPVYLYVSIMMLIGLLGNSVTCYIFGYRLRQTVTRNFIFSLALLDLISSVFTMPSEIYFLATITSFNHPELCKFFRYLTYVFHSSTSLILLLIAWDRFYKVTYPLKTFFNVQKSRLYCIMSVLISICIAWPSVLLYGSKTLPNSTGTTCAIDDEMEPTVWPFIFYFTFTMCFSFVAISMVVLYSCVIKQVQKLRTNQILRKRREKASLKAHSHHVTRTVFNTYQVNPDLGNNEDEGKESPILYDMGVLGNKSAVFQTSHPDSSKPNSSRTVEVPEIIVDECEPEVDPCENVCSTSSGSENAEKQTNHLNVVNKCLNLFHHDVSITSDITSGHGTLTDSEDERNEEPEVKTTDALVRVFSKKKENIEKDKPEVRRMSRQISRQKSASHPRKTTRMLLAVTLFFVLSFLPFFTVVIIRAYMKDSFYSALSMSAWASAFYGIFVRSYLVSNAVNPIIYGILNSHFRQEVKKIMRGNCRKSKRRLTLRMSLDQLNSD